MVYFSGRWFWERVHGKSPIDGIGGAVKRHLVKEFAKTPEQYLIMRRRRDLAIENLFPILINVLKELTLLISHFLGELQLLSISFYGIKLCLKRRLY